MAKIVVSVRTPDGTKIGFATLDDEETTIKVTLKKDYFSIMRSMFLAGFSDALIVAPESKPAVPSSES